MAYAYKNALYAKHLSGKTQISEKSQRESGATVNFTALSIDTNIVKFPSINIEKSLRIVFISCKILPPLVKT